MRVLVAGATGYLGGYVVRALHRDGHRVRALVRRRAGLGDLEPLCDEVVEAQATQPETLDGLADGCDVAYIGLGVRSARRRPSFWDVDRDANLNVLKAALAAGVEHLIFIAAINSDLLAERGVGPALARETVVQAMRDSGRRYTVFRGTGFFNDMSELFHMAEKGRGWLVGDGSLRMNPVHGADLADDVARSIEDPNYWDQELSRGGPDVLTLREIFELAFDVLDKTPKLTRLPVALMTPARWLVRPFNATLAGFIHAIQAAHRLSDMTAPSCGDRTLRSFYEELATERQVV